MGFLDHMDFNFQCFTQSIVCLYHNKIKRTRDKIPIRVAILSHRPDKEN